MSHEVKIPAQGDVQQSLDAVNTGTSPGESLQPQGYEQIYNDDESGYWS